MAEESDNPFARLVSLEATEVAIGQAEGRAVAEEFLRSLRAGQLHADALHQLMKSEASNAFDLYRFQGICAHLQEALTRSK